MSESFKKQILLIYTVHFLEKINKILQNARCIYQELVFVVTFFPDDDSNVKTLDLAHSY
jgi:hypothetical protein